MLLNDAMIAWLKLLDPYNAALRYRLDTRIGGVVAKVLIITSVHTGAGLFAEACRDL